MNIDQIHSEYKLNDGNVLQLFEPDNSGQGPMKAGRCPGCQNGLEGYLGRCACVRELIDGDLTRPTWGPYSTNYGHYDCVQMIWFRIIKRLDEPETNPPVHLWKVGTQRQMILFVQQAGDNGQHVVVSYDGLAGRDQRYKFHIDDRNNE